MTKARAPHAASPDELSESARAVVHDAGDPRIDAHLRALGLADDPVALPVAPTPAPVQRDDTPGIEALRARVLELEAAVAASARRARWLAVAAVIAIVTAAALAVLLIGQVA